MNCFSHLFTVQFTHVPRPFVIVCFEVFYCEIHGMLPLLQINMLPFYHGDSDGDSHMRGWMGTILKLVVGIGLGMGISVPGTVGDGCKYLSPCSCLAGTPIPAGLPDATRTHRFGSGRVISPQVQLGSGNRLSHGSGQVAKTVNPYTSSSSSSSSSRFVTNKTVAILCVCLCTVLQCGGWRTKNSTD